MAQMARWLAYIEQFDFEIQHRAGTKDGNADGLSRTPTHDDAVRTVKQQNGDSSVDDIINDRDEGAVGRSRHRTRSACDYA